MKIVGVIMVVTLVCINFSGFIVAGQHVRPSFERDKNPLEHGEATLAKQRLAQRDARARELAEQRRASLEKRRSL